MKYGLTFALGTLFGALIGGAVTLLFAPSSGEDLRSNIKTQADTQYARVQSGVQKGVQEVQTRVEKISSDLQARSGGSKDAVSPASEV